jgi:hypothetical protein
MPQADQLAVEVVTAAASLVTEFQPMPLLGEPPCKLGDLRCRVRDRADEVDRPIAAFLGNRRRNAGLVHVQPDVKRLLHHEFPRIVDTPRSPTRHLTVRESPTPHTARGIRSRAHPEYFNKEIDRGRRVMRYRLESR